MGCFLACFGTKDKKRQKSAIKNLPRNRSHGTYGSLHQTCSPHRPAAEIQTGSIPDSSVAQEELSCSSRKKVTFDLNVKSYSEISADEYLNSVLEIESKKEIETAEAIEKEAIEKGNQSLALSEDNSTASTASTTSSYPSSHRYQNCASSEEDNDDDDDDYDDDEDDYDGEGEEESLESEESFESNPSSVERETIIYPAKEGKQEIKSGPICDSPTNEKSKLLVSQNARDRSQYVHSVLNPVENLSQWNALKRNEAQGAMLVKQQRKENAISKKEPEITFSSEPNFKHPKHQFDFNSDHISKHPKPRSEPEISVVASLSNWLPPLETPSISKSNKFQSSVQAQGSSPATTNSSRSHDDRPILGALTLAEINWASPRRSPCHSPDEIPILGTVGTHWNHENQGVNSRFQSFGLENKGIPNTTSKYKEDMRVNWHSTPFEVRLERAIHQGSAEAYNSYSPFDVRLETAIQQGSTEAYNSYSPGVF